MDRTLTPFLMALQASLRRQTQLDVEENARIRRHDSFHLGHGLDRRSSSGTSSNNTEGPSPFSFPTSTSFPESSSCDEPLWPNPGSSCSSMCSSASTVTSAVFTATDSSESFPVSAGGHGKVAHWSDAAATWRPHPVLDSKDGRWQPTGGPRDRKRDRETDYEEARRCEEGRPQDGEADRFSIRQHRRTSAHLRANVTARPPCTVHLAAGEAEEEEDLSLGPGDPWNDYPAPRDKKRIAAFLSKPFP